MVEQAKIQRSTTTGYLVITAPKANIEEIVQRKMRLDSLRESKAQAKKL